MVHCKLCNGTGAKNGELETCSTCRGSGYLKHKANGNIYTDCRQCNKTGKIIKDFCTTCFGNAVVPEENTIDITIPAGAYEGLQFEIKSAGNFGKGIAHPGNLIILISEQRHEIFRRIKTDIHFDLFISVFDAIIGNDNMEVPTINGKVKIKLDAGTENGKVLRLQGKGIPDIANQYRMGDQFIHVNVYIPKNMSEDAMDIFKNMSQTDTIGESCAVTPDKIQGIKGSFERMNEFKNLYI